MTTAGLTGATLTRRHGLLRAQWVSVVAFTAALVLDVALVNIFVVYHRDLEIENAFIRALSAKLEWGFGVLAVVFVPVWSVFGMPMVLWLAGRTEVTEAGLVIRSLGGVVDVPWIDVAELAAVPHHGGHLYRMRTEVPLPGGWRGWCATAGAGGGKDLWLGWHAGSDAAIAAIAGSRIGIRYRRV